MNAGQIKVLCGQLNAPKHWRFDRKGLQKMELSESGFPQPCPEKALPSPHQGVPTQTPPVYGNHANPDQMVSMQIIPSNALTGWEPADIVDMACAGEILLHPPRAWCRAVEPAIRHLECIVRGIPSCVDRQTYETALEYLGNLRKQLCALMDITDPGDMPTDTVLAARSVELENLKLVSRS